jgi:type VI secretion system secreted protein VgrG
MVDLQGALQALPGRQAYYLDVPGVDSAAALSVVSFTATEKMGEPNVVHIELTHPQQLPRADFLNRDAVFSIVADYGTVRRFSGYIERFSTVEARFRCPGLDFLEMSGFEVQKSLSGRGF